MKRTFTVTIECADDDDIDRTRVHLALDNAFVIPSEYISVTDITATHAKERELIKATIREETASDDLSDTPCDAMRIAFNWAHDARRKLARELRALMEGKA